MAVGPVDPREVLKGVEALLGKDGELRSLEGVAKVFRWDLNTYCTRIGDPHLIVILISWFFKNFFLLLFFRCSLMKASHKMVSRCMYLNILLQTKSHDILNRYVYIAYTSYRVQLCFLWVCPNLQLFCFTDLSVLVAISCWTLGWLIPRLPPIPQCCSSFFSLCRNCLLQWTISNR